MTIKQTILTTTAIAAGFAGASAVASADQVTVKSGDTLAQIASEQGTSVTDLANINKIDNVDLIFVGATIETTATTQTQATSVQPVAAPVQETEAPVQQAPAKQEEAPVQQAPAQQAPAQHASATASGSGSTHDQFLANGGSEAMWQTIVMPESGGNANAVSSAGYRGLGQTKEGWGAGSVSQQTQGMVNYATSRYGSVDGAVAFRQANGWW